MKGLVFACLVVSLQSMTVAQAYEADIHYSTTYVLARAIGWPEADALVIASANEAMDENQDTAAALELDTTPELSLAGDVTSSVHQAEKNLRFHCFSRTPGQAGQISADVLEVISAHFAEVPAVHADPRGTARRLIALGVALHCQQDAYSHAGFGGSCGSNPGSCYGHTYQTFLDQVIYGYVGKHLHNPDHPGVGQWLLQVLQGTVSELATRRPKASVRPIPADVLVALSDNLRASGLELPDAVRRNCNRYIAGKWLFDFFESGSKSQHGSPDTLEKLAPEIAVTCRNASLASATVVSIPAPRYPRLNSDALPYLVRADGTYRLVRDGDFDVFSPGIEAEGIAGLNPNYNNHKVQLSHWSQLLALPITVPAALLSATATARQGEFGRAKGRCCGGNAPAPSLVHSPAEAPGSAQSASFIAMASSASFERSGRARAGMSLRAAIWSLL